MTYSQYSSRQTIETRGKIKLFSDNFQQLFVLNGNKKIYFKPPSNVPKSFSPLTKGFWGASNWDFFGAEEEGEYIKLAIRLRIDVLDHEDDMYSDDYHHFEIITFDRKGNWIAEETNNQGVEWFSTDNSDDLQRIKELF